MAVERQYDVAVVGAGPAGIAAACAATRSGAEVCVIDDNPAPGGQIWRAVTDNPWLERFEHCGAELLSSTRVFGCTANRALLAERSRETLEIRYRTLVLATGARERFLPFPGWTLPHVFGAGGLQALVKGGWPIEGKKVVVAGSGPLQLAVAQYLRSRGAVVPVVCEQTGWRRIARFTQMLASHPGKLLQGAWLRARLVASRYYFSCWPLRTEPGLVTLQQRGKTWMEHCDYLACGFGLVPNAELAALLGCAIGDGAVVVNERLETSVPGIYCAGEAIGIGGVECAINEGAAAGCYAAGLDERAESLGPARTKSRQLQAAMEHAFALRPELRDLATTDTIVCRCEDVPLGRIREHGSWRGAKLQTRCGMGPCQGRVCGPAVEFLTGWRAESVRPPVAPVALGRLI
ncbi:MAG: FAD/NAD(P)-binding oxidoreductase [Bryobacteraceae bacterium]